jgi:hypothetical protein
LGAVEFLHKTLRATVKFLKQLILLPRSLVGDLLFRPRPCAAGEGFLILSDNLREFDFTLRRRRISPTAGGHGAAAR